MTAADYHPDCGCLESYPQLLGPGVVVHGPGCPHRDAHRDCWFGEPCAIGKPAECPPCIAEAKRDRGTPWSELIERHEDGDVRHYLDGRDVHCGDVIELQGMEQRSDDYGDYGKRLPTGELVRYEASIAKDRHLFVRLFTRVAGFEFSAAADPWMRFRWPVR